MNPAEAVREALAAGEKKAELPIADMVLRGFLSGVFLAYATSLALGVTAQGMPPFIGALLFPVGFVILVLLGLELVTGNFAVLPLALIAGRVQPRGLLCNWGWVYLGNLLGGGFYAALAYLTLTTLGILDGGALGEQIRQLAEKKTLAYAAVGLQGWSAALLSGILCNWMVTLGTVLAFVSRSTVGKIVAMWLPIMTFFGLGYEHAVVNMYVIPAAMLLGAPISLADWWVWNQIPVTVGNIIGGALFTGLALYFTYARNTREAQAALGAVPGDREEKPDFREAAVLPAAVTGKASQPNR